MSGFMQETMINDGSKEQIQLVAQFETAGDEWVDDAFLQNFLEFPNPSRPGEFIGATCNTRYTRSNGTAEKFFVETMVGESLSNSAAGDRQWRDYGIMAPEELFTIADDDWAYEGTYVGGKSSQACAIKAVLWEQVDGEADYDDNADYWFLKNELALYVTAGFRLWTDEDNMAPQFKADTEVFAY